MYNSVILLVSFSKLYIYHNNPILEHFHDSPQIPSSPLQWISAPSPAPGTTDLVCLYKFAFSGHFM